jgi:hypothetical protein
MAKGDGARREAKKPKKDKTKSSAAPTTLDVLRARPSPMVPAGKQKSRDS